MYPYRKEGTSIHYIGDEGILLGSEKRYIVNDVEVYMYDKLDGEKSKEEIVQEIASELESDDMTGILDILNRFLESKPDYIQLSEEPHPVKLDKTGKKGKILPMFAVLTLTNKCIMACEHCYMNCDPAGKSMLDYEQVIHTLDYLEGQIRSMQLTGGEPMAYPRFLEVLDYCTARFNTTVTTSAALITEENVHHFKGVDKVQVSVYSHDPAEHDRITNLKGSFKRTKKGIELLLSIGVETSIATIVTKKNRHDMEKLIEWAIDLGVQDLELAQLTPVGRGKALQDELCQSKEERIEFEGLLQRLAEGYRDSIQLSDWKEDTQNRNMVKDRGCFDCGGGLYSWTISENGHIKPCPFVPDEYGSLGNISHEPIEAIVERFSLQNLVPGVKSWQDYLESIDSNLGEVCNNIERYYLDHCC